MIFYRGFRTEETDIIGLIIAYYFVIEVVPILVLLYLFRRFPSKRHMAVSDRYSIQHREGSSTFGALLRKEKEPMFIQQQRIQS
mmetsp:Transcript_26839/g.69001  ORF Transcript_26839/g.69001 Transcript_26839/m.69001 type:complete len:84 (-) Transcript_26839:263-514(-)